jgi:uncharacterized protein YecT (DUF1311 family)
VIAATLLALVAGPAAAQEAPAPSPQVAACVAAADRDPEAERACVGAASLACIEAGPDGQTTVGMMECYMAETAAWDAEFNAVYASLLALAEAMAAADPSAAEPSAAEPSGDAASAADPAAVSHAALLREAQRAWIAFRDADCAEAAGYWGEGSMRLVAGAECMMERTAGRTLELLEKRRAYESP